MTTTMISSLTKEILIISREQDVVPFRNRVKEHAVKIKMGLVNQTKLMTAASEMIRNMLRYGEGGQASVETISRGSNSGVRLIFVDKGPGIADIEMAMKDGFSTGKSLGLGLPGTKRLVNEFDIQSELGKGTVVMLIKWVNG